MATNLHGGTQVASAPMQQYILHEAVASAVMQLLCHDVAKLTGALARLYLHHESRFRTVQIHPVR